MSIQPIQVNHNYYELSNDFYTPTSQDILEALELNDSEKLRELLAQGANPNTPLELDGSTMDALVKAIGGFYELKPNSFESTIIPICINEILYTIITTCINETFTEGSIPPLFFAAHTRNVEAVRALVEAGADVHFKIVADGKTTSPLLADSGERGAYIEIMEILYQHGLAIEEMIDSEYDSVAELLKDAHEEGNNELVAFLENHGYSLKS